MESSIGDISHLSKEEKDKITLEYVQAITHIATNKQSKPAEEE